MKSLLLGGLVVVGSMGCAQAQTAESSVPDAVTASARLLTQRYAQAVGEPSHLYSGPEYVDYKKPFVLGHQFFASKEEAPGTIRYNGFVFREVPMRYDVYQDEVVLEHRSSGLQLKLVEEKVDGFTVHGHTFVRLPADSVAKNDMVAGFYDLLTEGRARLLVKRGKKLNLRPGKRTMEGEFAETAQYFVQRGGKYYAVSSKGRLLKALADRKKELQQYAAQQHLSFAKAQREHTFAVLVAQYNQLVSQSQ